VISSHSTDREERPGRDILDYLEIPVRYARRAVLSFLLVMAVAVLLTLYAPRKYRSSTLILVESEAVPAEYLVTERSKQAMSQRLASIRQVVLSHSRLEQIIKELDPYPDKADQPMHVVVEVMRGAIDIRLYGRDSFSFAYVNRSPEKTRLVTDKIAELFITDTDRLRERLTERAFTLLKENLVDARRALEERERALSAFEQANWESLPDRLDSNLRMLQQLQLEQQTLGERLSVLEGRRATVEAALREGRRLDASGGRPPPPDQQLDRLRAQLEQLRSRYTDRHPEVRRVRAQIGRLESQIAGRSPISDRLTDPEIATLEGALEAVEKEISDNRQARGQLDERLAVFKARVEATPEAKQALAGLYRDHKQLQREYQNALERAREAELAHKLEEYWRSGYFSVLDPAYLPGRPIYPYTMLFMVGGFLAAIGVGLASALLGDLLDRTVKTEAQLANVVPYPVLAVIPRVKPRSMRNGRRNGS